MTDADAAHANWLQSWRTHVRKVRRELEDFLKDQKPNAETRRTAPDDGLDQKITPLTKDNHPEQDVLRLSDRIVAILDPWTRGAFTGWKGMTGDSKITLDEAEDHFSLCMQDMLDDLRAKLSTDATTDSRDLSLQVEPLSGPSPAVLVNEELVRALEGVIRIADRETDEFIFAREVLSRAKPSP